jgi:hypothetical protein
VTGANAGDFYAGACPSTLAAGGTCTIYVRFIPLAAGARAATLQITDSDATSPQSVSLHGEGVAPVASASPMALSFAAPVNTVTAPQTVAVTNTGTAPLTINGIMTTGASASEFIQTNDCGTFPATLAIGASCTVSVRFAPTTTANKTALLYVGVASPAASVNVALAGTVQTAAAALEVTPTALSFANQLVGTTSASQNVTLRNVGGTSMTISGVSISGANPADFATSSWGVLLPGATATLKVTFTPKAMGARAATLTVTAGGSSYPVSLSGTGIAPIATASPTSLAFVSPVGSTSDAQTITLGNAGTAPLVITRIVPSGASANQFVQTNDCGTFPAVVAVGATCTVSVQFAPTTAGNKVAILYVGVASPGVPLNIPLAGTQ